MLLVWVSMSLAGSVEEAMKFYWAGEYDKAVVMLKPIADSGNAEAAYRLGNIYEYGMGMNADYGLAFHYYHIAANKGDLKSQYLLAMQYFRGTGTAGNFSSCLYWLQRAAKGGNDKAAYTLGYFYENGIGVKKSGYWANYWYKKAKE